MLKNKSKSTALMTGITVVSVLLLSVAVADTIILALFSEEGINAWLVIERLTIAASRMTFRVSIADGVLSGWGSMTDSFVLMAVMLYSVPPSYYTGLTFIPAALVGIVSNHGIATVCEI